MANMSKSEMEQKIKEQQEQIDKYKSRARKQNEKAKEKWETVSCRLPIGTKGRIERHGLSINGLINRLVLTELDRLDAETGKTTQEAEKEVKTDTVSAEVPF